MEKQKMIDVTEAGWHEPGRQQSGAKPLHLIEDGDAEPTDISDMGVLSEALRTKELTAGNLYEETAVLLNHCGQKTTVNDLPAVVTPYSYPVRLGNQALFARLGYRAGKDGSVGGSISIIFSTDNDLSDIQTNNGYFSALSFDSSGSHLVSGTGENPAIDDKKSMKLATAIVSDIKRQFAQERKAVQAATAAALAEAQKKTEEEHAEHETAEAKRLAQEAREKTRRQQARKTAAKGIGTTALIASLLWYNSIHSAIAGDKIDAKLGAIPMPAPIEWLVDLNNHSDHIAQGFAAPKAALPVTVGMGPSSIPLLTSYDTTGVPDASYNGFHYGEYKELSKPGLYGSDFDSDYKYDSHSDDNQSAAFGDDGTGCYDIQGDYKDGKTTIFSQTVGVNNMIQVSVPDLHTLKVCKAPGAPKHFKGSVFVYQKP